MIGLYFPGTSLLHRLGTIPKLAGLAVFMLGLALLREPWQLGLAALLVATFFIVARIPPTALWPQLRPLLGLLLFAVPFQLIFTGWFTTLMVSGRLVSAVSLAALFTLTTPVPHVLDACRTMLHPFRRFVDPDRVGLLMALTIRCVPLLAEIVREVMEARRARGTTGSLQALVVPVIVRSLQSAEALGEALIARGFDD